MRAKKKYKNKKVNNKKVHKKKSIIKKKTNSYRSILEHDQILEAINKAQISKKTVKIAISKEDDYMVQNLLKDAECLFKRVVYANKINFDIISNRQEKCVYDIDVLTDEFFEDNFLI